MSRSAEAQARSEGGRTIGRRREESNSARPPVDPGIDREAEIRAFAAGLTESQRMLVAVRDGLYEGDWEAMLGDLRARLTGRPYIFKLVNRIQDDIADIERLVAFEARHGIDLADYVGE